MAIYRTVNMSFWTDTKVVDDYTPEDKYFMLYCLTNQYTNIIGCYEISIKQMSYDLGYNVETVEKIIDRFNSKHKTILYDKDTKELFIANWHKYNWSSSPKLDSCLSEDISKVKSIDFRNKLIELYNSRDSIEEKIDMVSIPYTYHIDTTDSNSNSNSISNTNSNTNRNSNTNSNSISNNIYSSSEMNDTVEIINEKDNVVRRIITYLNEKTGKSFKYTTKKTQSLIKARLKSGYSEEIIKEVIDKKCVDWLNNDMNKYLRPETLFNESKFEGYINERKSLNKTVSQSKQFKEILKKGLIQ